MSPQSNSPFDETLDATPSPAGESAGTGSRRTSAPRMALVAGSGGRISDDIQSLLRSRLRAAALLMLIGFGVFLIRAAYLYFSGTAGTDVTGFGLSFHAVVTLAMAGFAVMLCRHCQISTRVLRWDELVIFGLPAAYFVWTQATRMQACAADGYLPSPLPPWAFLMFTYAMFIPNTWRRAAVVLGTMAVLPISMTLLLWWRHYDCAIFIGNNPGFVSEVVLYMSIGVIGCTFGVHTINTLRSEAHRAKQLGQYRLRERLGAGGMGEVYLAEHQLMKRPCAIKLIHPEKAGDARTLARFEREVRATAALSHWNTIDIYDYGRAEDGTFYYVMEYLPGLSLDRLVKLAGPLPAARAIHFLRQTCGALEEAHQAGVIHRDIKPGNVFAAQRGGHYDVTKLLDFGLAKPTFEDSEITQLTQEGSLTGSPLYMAPEQAAGVDEAEPRSDIYSLGAVAYFLLTGHLPFEHSNMVKVLLAHASEPVKPPSEWVAEVPADLEQVVLRCLAKRPEDRYPSAAALAEALDRCQCAGDWTQQDATQWWENLSQMTVDATAEPDTVLAGQPVA